MTTPTDAGSNKTKVVKTINDRATVEHMANRFKLDLDKLPDEFTFREVRSDTQSSVILLGQHILRQYMSEFVLPDDTRVAVRRLESSFPSDNTQAVVVCLAVGHPEEVVEGCSDEIIPTSDDDSEATELRRLPCGEGLRIENYLDDDLWAATILECDSATNGELLRQLEDGCRIDPDAFRMERLQRRRNWRTIVDVQKAPQTRNLGFSRTTSETGSVLTETTSIG